MRTFIAIEVPEPARLAASAYQDGWRLLWPAGAVSWTRPEGFHLTLRFLGEIQERQAKDIVERLPALAATAPIPASFTGPMGFPNLRRPGVLALETEAPPALLQVADDLDHALKGLALERRDKPFRAHLTLGRVRNKAIAAPEPPPFGRAITWSAARVVLLQSFLGPGGSRYEELGAVDLAGSH